MSYQTVRDAAEQRSRADSPGAWALADAVLGEVPEVPPQRRNAEGRNQHTEVSASREVQTSVPEQLDLLASKLAIDGITTPDGGRYSARALANLRKTALAWPEQQRYPKAAFRTHQEIGRPDREAGKKKAEVLTALCQYAEGEELEVLPVPSQQWKKATKVIDRLVERDRTYPVSANALRVALGHDPNTPDETERIARKAQKSSEQKAAGVESDETARGSSLTLLTEMNRVVMDLRTLAEVTIPATDAGELRTIQESLASKFRQIDGWVTLARMRVVGEDDEQLDRELEALLEGGDQA